MAEGVARQPNLSAPDAAIDEGLGELDAYVETLREKMIYENRST
jgi:hypothetical protein